MFYLSTYKKPSPKEALRRASKAEVPTIEETADKAVEAIASVGNAVAEMEPLKRIASATH